MICIKTLLVYPPHTQFNDEVNETPPEATEKIGHYFPPKKFKKAITDIGGHFSKKYPGRKFEFVMRDETIELKQQQ
jgi:hypothetical protein